MFSTRNLIIVACVFISAIQPVLSKPISPPDTRLDFLSRRQATSSEFDSNGMPTQCTAPCQLIVAVMSNGSCTDANVTCLCNDTLASAYLACVGCAVAHAGVPQDRVDGDIVALKEECSAAGMPISIGASSRSRSSTTRTGAVATQTSGASTAGRTAAAADDSASTTPAPDAGARADGESSTGTTSAPTTSTTSGALRLSTSIVGGVFSAF